MHDNKLLIGGYVIMNHLFPSGWEQFLIGGFSIGIGVSLMFVATGRVVGLSSFFSSSLSWFSKLPFLQQPSLVDSRVWRLACALGLIIGAMLWAHYFNPAIYLSNGISPLQLLIGGTLVGFGSRLSNGCTSGHGICGISSLSLPSLVAVMIFMGFAITTALIMSLLNGGLL